MKRTGSSSLCTTAEQLPPLVPQLPMQGVLRAPKPPLVLIVEPHADTSDMYCDYFSHQDVSTITASNALDALAVALMPAPTADVVVTNIKLPGELDGIDLVTRLRGTARTRRIGTIILSARAFSSDEERARAAGCDLFVLKPCLPEVLLKQVRRLLRIRRS
jgi:two-component system, cell cycle response regulator DivK